MTVERSVSWLFGINAVINCTVSIRGILDPLGAAASFGGTPPNYPAVIRLWMCFVFMFGCMFLEVARDPRRKAALAKYNWIEKTLTAICITAGFFSGQIPSRLMLLIVFTNWIWIPVILWSDFALRRSVAAPQHPD